MTQKPPQLHELQIGPHENAPKQYIEASLSCYAAFFAGISDGVEEAALKNLHKIRSIDREAEEALHAEEFEYYKHRRTYLMRLFRERLMEELQGQVETAILAKAQELINNLEVCI